MDLFKIISYIWRSCVSWLMSVPIFGTNMFYFLIGLIALGFAIKAIKMLFYGSIDDGGDK